MVYLGFLRLLTLDFFSKRQRYAFRMMHEFQKQSPKGVLKNNLKIYLAKYIGTTKFTALAPRPFTAIILFNLE